MGEYGVDELAGFAWMESRIPAQPGLVAFVPDGARDPAVGALAATHPSRWYPQEGGTRVVVLFDDDLEFDPTRWHVEQGAWDHEHCDMCEEHIPSMTLCWVTEVDPYVLLCDACHAKVVATARAGERG